MIDYAPAALSPKQAQIAIGEQGFDERFPPITHPQLAEMRLFDELGEGNADHGVNIAVAMRDERFVHLRTLLTKGLLTRQMVRAAARGRIAA